MKQQIVIQPGNDADRDAIKKLHYLAYKNNRQIYRLKKQAGSIIEDPDIDAQDYLAYLDNELVGMVTLWAERGSCYIGNLAVDPVLQGKGIGRALIAQAERFARENGLAELRAKTIKQTGSLPFYQKLGFHVETEAEPDWAEGVGDEKITELTLIKKIS